MDDRQQGGFLLLGCMRLSYLRDRRMARPPENIVMLEDMYGQGDDIIPLFGSSIVMIHPSRSSENPGAKILGDVQLSCLNQVASSDPRGLIRFLKSAANSSLHRRIRSNNCQVHGLSSNMVR